MADYLLPWDDDACTVVDRVLALVEPKHTMLILAILLLDGPQHFGELRRTLGGVSAKSLSARLRALEEAGLVSRTPEIEGKVQRTRYAATSSAAGFYDVLCAMRDWGRDHLDSSSAPERSQLEPRSRSWRAG